ncbi:Alpha/Beta hydrolase fold [Fusarium oxysporum f. sp. vasinfectum]|nr:Alpha/Beta hydrolase fold [Fusarium oxysporum f. sp. vasinfectum]
MTLVPVTLESANAHNSCHFLFPTRRGDYLIQVSWPLCWNDRAPVNDDTIVSTVYIVDGNAYFFTATDIARRLEFTHQTRAVIVAVGYPNKTCVFDKRRNGDLTPASSDGAYDIPLDQMGNHRLVLLAAHRIFWISSRMISNRPKALFGHSYGGLFTLNALFTKPESFDTFIAASPSIWFNNCSIVRDQEQRFNERDPLTGRAPRLLVMFGGAEQTLIQLPGESDEKFEKKQKGATLRKMRDNALALVARMEESPHLRNVWCWEFEGEDHGCAAPCALQRGLLRFLIDQRAGQ